ncbi:DUF3263 domain-containing protein [Mycobacterium sp. NPDC003323]
MGKIPERQVAPLTVDVRRGIDPLDRAILTFALHWLPYDGGPLEDTLADFGMTAHEYLLRLHELVERHYSCIRPDVATRLRRMCEWRLRQYGNPSHVAAGAARKSQLRESAHQYR